MKSVAQSVTIQELVPLLFVDDIEACVGFYVEKLGFALEREWRPDNRLAWCRLSRGGAALMLQQACEEDGPADHRGQGVGFYFNCDDVFSLHADFIARGLHCSPPKHAHYGENQIELTDPAGYHIVFQSAAKP